MLAEMNMPPETDGAGVRLAELGVKVDPAVNNILLIDAILIGRFQEWLICSSINGSLGSSRMRDSGLAPVIRDHR